ncbi:hypothetical protein JCM33374_g1362 [Metschnikowia sp. JCM 33374]|nr:hypothetical protein JCM33374_g1362 [Metschnikowia sp. JCM 33374]
MEYGELAAGAKRGPPDNTRAISVPDVEDSSHAHFQLAEFVDDPGPCKGAPVPETATTHPQQATGQKFHQTGSFGAVGGTEERFH